MYICNMKGVIYKYYNQVTDMYYIGQTRDSFSKRDWAHRHANPKNRSWFDNVYTKHSDQFTHSIIVTVESPNKKLLIGTLNELEIVFIAQYKNAGKKLYNFLEGGNVGWTGKAPTFKMLEALGKGRDAWNTVQKNNKKSPEEARISHRNSCKKYEASHPDKYKQHYMEQNNKRADKRHEWYLKNRERILAKLHSKTKKYQKEKALANSCMNLSLPK